MLIFFLAAGKHTDKMQKNHGSNGMYNLLQNEVGFTKGQLDQYQALRTEQWAQARPLFDQLRNSKTNFYKLMYSSSNSDSLINANADSIAQKQKALDVHMFRYFKNVRNICQPGQLTKFDSTIAQDIVRMIGGPPRPSGGKKPKFTK